jgi:hypothetical protein
MEGIVGNRTIESARSGERAEGREAVDTRVRGGVADISSPPRTIEVKAYGGSARGQDLWLETTPGRAALVDGDFWL